MNAVHALPSLVLGVLLVVLCGRESLRRKRASVRVRVSGKGVARRGVG